ncbi:MAG: hypothetical protein AAF597_18825, partial [Bacteroidota bacterium]
MLRHHQLTAAFLSALRAQGHAFGVGELQRAQELLNKLPAEASDEVLRDSLVALFALGPGEQERCRQLFAQAQREAKAMALETTAIDRPLEAAARKDRRKLFWQLGAVLLLPLLFLVASLLTPDSVIVLLPERHLLLMEGTKTNLPETDSLPEIGQVADYEFSESGTDEAPVFGRMDAENGVLSYEAMQVGEDTFSVRLVGTEDRIGV